MAAFLLVLLTVAPNVDELIQGLNSTDFQWRTRSTEALKDIIIAESHPDVYNLLIVVRDNKTNPPEARYRAAAVVDYYFVLAKTADVPIWSLPREYRYVQGQDLALLYYQKAAIIDAKYPLYNQDEPMRAATRLFLKDKLASRELLWHDAADLVLEMSANWQAEQSYIYAPHIYKLNFNLSKVPAPVEERLQDLLDRPDWMPGEEPCFVTNRGNGWYP